MTHQEALNLIHKLEPSQGGFWADLGAGSGVFTRAFAELLGKEGRVFAVDRSTNALERLSLPTGQADLMITSQDFTKPLDLPLLDGIFMGNSLHYVRRQEKLLKQLINQLKPAAKLAILEYDMYRANPWIPFPIPFEKLELLCRKAGLGKPKKVATHPSRYHNEMYLALIELSN